MPKVPTHKVTKLLRMIRKLDVEKAFNISCVPSSLLTNNKLSLVIVGGLYLYWFLFWKIMLDHFVRLRRQLSRGSCSGTDKTNNSRQHQRVLDGRDCCIYTLMIDNDRKIVSYLSRLTSWKIPELRFRNNSEQPVSSGPAI